MISRFVFLISSFLSATNALAANMKGDVFDKDTHTKKLFDWSRKETVTGPETKIHISFVSPDGAEAATEDAVVENGKLKSYVVNQLQTKEKGSLTVKEKKIYFEYTKKGETSKSEEDVTDNLVAAPSIIGYLTQHWDVIAQGKSVPVRLAVLDRKETVGFEFFRTEDKKSLTASEWVIKMKPTSIFIAAIVSPLYFWISKDGAKLHSIEGRTLPKRPDNENWADLDAFIKYQYVN